MARSLLQTPRHLRRGDATARRRIRRIFRPFDQSGRTARRSAWLDLLYEFCQWALHRFAAPRSTHLTLYRGVNGLDEHEIVERTTARTMLVRMNNLSSFSATRDIAGCFGDTTLTVSWLQREIAVLRLNDHAGRAEYGSGSKAVGKLQGRYQPTAGADKVMRLHAQTALVENGHVHLPKSAPWLGDYVSELLSFPGARYDDQVDSTVQFLDYMHTKRKPLVISDEVLRRSKQGIPWNMRAYRVW